MFVRNYKNKPVSSLWLTGLFLFEHNYVQNEVTRYNKWSNYLNGGKVFGFQATRK